MIEFADVEFSQQCYQNKATHELFFDKSDVKINFLKNQPSFWTEEQEKFPVFVIKNTDVYEEISNYNQSNNQVLDKLNKNVERFDPIKLFKIAPEATCSIYVEGVPIDATEREVAHIFRPFPGYLSSWLILKEKSNGKKYFFCFVDFDNYV